MISIELTTIKGIVIRERQSGDNDKFLDILTDTHGLIEVMAKGVKKITCQFAAASQLYAYSKFCLSKRRDRYYIESAETIRIFYPIRESLDKLSLVSYFSEIISYAQFPDKNGNKDVLRLFLNVLHYLSEGTRDDVLLKCIFELRFMAETGHMPNVVGCTICNTYSAAEMFFVIRNGTLYCGKCFSGYGKCDAVQISAPVLHAVRHIVLTDFDRLFNFKLSNESLALLSSISEQYLVIHLGRAFKTLEFYKGIQSSAVNKAGNLQSKPHSEGDRIRDEYKDVRRLRDGDVT